MNQTHPSVTIALTQCCTFPKQCPIHVMWGKIAFPLSCKRHKPHNLAQVCGCVKVCGCCAVMVVVLGIDTKSREWRQEKETQNSMKAAPASCVALMLLIYSPLLSNVPNSVMQLSGRQQLERAEWYPHKMGKFVFVFIYTWDGFSFKTIQNILFTFFAGELNLEKSWVFIWIVTKMFLISKDSV